MLLSRPGLAGFLDLEFLRQQKRVSQSRSYILPAQHSTTDKNIYTLPSIPLNRVSNASCNKLLTKVATLF